MTQKRLFGAAAATALMTALAGCQHALPTEEMTVEEATVVEEVTEPASLMVTGSATYREKIALPEGAVLSVTLEDVAMADAVARRIETYDIPMDGISVPQAFELSVPDAETKTAKLAVRAKITSADGDLLFTTTTINPALPTGGDIGMIVMERVAAQPAAEPVKTDVEKLELTGRGNEPGWSVRLKDGVVNLSHQFGTETLAAKATSLSEDGATRTINAYDGDRLVIITQTMEPCADDSTGAMMPYAVTVQVGERVLKGCGGSLAERLTQGEWQVEDINGGGIIDSSHMTLKFGDDGRVSGSAGCNNYSATYTVSGTKMTVGPVASTRRMCPGEAIMNQEQRMLAALAGEQDIQFTEDGALKLRAASGFSILARIN